MLPMTCVTLLEMRFTVAESSLPRDARNCVSPASCVLAASFRASSALASKDAMVWSISAVMSIRPRRAVNLTCASSTARLRLLSSFR